MLARKNLKPLTVAGAALALAAGTLAGVAPANAEPAHGGGVNTGVPGDTAVGPACSGSGAVAADSRKVLPSAWKTDHGTAPMAYKGEPGTGSVKDATRLAQKEPGSTEFTFKVRGDHGMVNAPDGKYQLSVGDALCGQMTTVTVKDGKVDASGNDAIRQAAGQQIVQVQGPLLDDDEAAKPENALTPYVGTDGKPSHFPSINAGATYLADQHLAMAFDDGTMTPAQATTGLQSMITGAKNVEVSDFGTGVLPDSGPVPATLSYTDAETGKLVTVDAGNLVKDGSRWTLDNDIVSKLPTGRFWLTVHGKDGQEQKMFFMIGDPSNGVEDAPLYDYAF